MNTRYCLALGGITLLTSAAVQAKLVQMRFQGTVVANSVTRAPWNAVVAGQTATFTYTFESLTPGVPQGGFATNYADAVTAVSATVGGISASGPGVPGSLISVADFNGGNDQYIVQDVGMPDGFEMLVILTSTFGSDPLINQSLPFFVQLPRWNDISQGYISDVLGAGNVRVELTSFELVSVQCPGDADGNEVANFADITEVLQNFGMGCP